MKVLNLKFDNQTLNLRFNKVSKKHLNNLIEKAGQSATTHQISKSSNIKIAMQNPRLAYRYAKSLIDLSVEQGQLENVFGDMQYLQAVCKSSKDFVNLLRSPIINSDKKQAVLDAVSKGKVGVITDSFNKLLVNKGREESLPEIITAFIEQYQSIKEIHPVKLTTAQPLSEDVKNAIISKLQTSTGMKNVELETAVKDELIGGFVLEYNNNLVDASILRDLQDIQRQFLSNDFVMKIR